MTAHSFQTRVDQYEYIAEEIVRNTSQDELDLDDILIVLADAYSARSEYVELERSLCRRGINSHLAGVSSSRDIFAVPGSVAVSGIYRAKGNEAPMVYIANADNCAQGWEMISLRNTLFTAITRSRAWVRLLGVGDGMAVLMGEIDKVRQEGYRLSFRIPTQDQLARIRTINRDRSTQEKEDMRKAEKHVDGLLALIERGDVTPELLAKLRRLQSKLPNDEVNPEGS